MGYPMTYSRVLGRNMLGGNYTQPRQYAPCGWYDGDRGISHPAGDDGPPFNAQTDEYRSALGLLSGDLRRLERDAIEPGYWREELARRAGVDEETVVKVLTAFWDGELPPGHAHDSDKGVKYFEGKYVENSDDAVRDEHGA